MREKYGSWAEKVPNERAASIASLQQNPTKRANNIATEYETTVKSASNFTKKNSFPQDQESKQLQGTTFEVTSSETAHYHPTIPELTILCTRKTPAADSIPKQ